MLQHLKEHPEVNILIVEKTDRLYRNFKDWVTLEEFIKTGLEVHLVKENEVIHKDSTSHQKFIHGIKLLMAKNFIDNLSEETRKGQKAKAESGMPPGWASLGYLNNTQAKTIEIDPERAPKVQQLFRLAATGLYSLKHLTEKTEEMGLRSRKSGRKLVKSYIHQLLQNPFYYGYFWLRGTLYPGKHMPLISKPLFDAVQQSLHQRQRPKKVSHAFAFGGFLTCARCGCAVVGELHKRRYTYYHCTYARGKCGSPYVREKALIEHLGGVVQGVELPENIVAWVKELIMTRQEASARTCQEQSAKLSHRQSELQQFLSQLYDDKLAGHIKADFWQEKHNAYQTEQAEIAAQLTSFHRQENSETMTFALRALEFTQNLYPRYVRKSPPEKRELLKTLLSNCRLDGVTPVPTYRNPFDKIAEGVKTKEWGP